MLRHLLTFALLCSFAGIAFAQSPIRRIEVPPAVLEDFQFRHPTAENVTWLQEGEKYYGARFTVAEQPAEAVYLPSGQWVQSKETIVYKQMPDEARKYCRSNYPDFHAHTVNQLNTRNYGVLYKIRIRKELTQVSMTFDMHGKLLEENEEQLEPEKKGLKGKLGKMFRKN
jgi:hypothetical protein